MRACVERTRVRTVKTYSSKSRTLGFMCGPAPPRVQARFHRFRGWPENLAEENKFIGIDLNKIEKNNAK